MDNYIRTVCSLVKTYMYKGKPPGSDLFEILGVIYIFGLISKYSWKTYKIVIPDTYSTVLLFWNCKGSTDCGVYR